MPKDTQDHFETLIINDQVNKSSRNPKPLRVHATAFAHWLCSSPGHWDSMEEYTCMIPRDTHDGAFYRAVLALHQDLFSLAQQVSCGVAEKRCFFFAAH